MTEDKAKKFEVIFVILGCILTSLICVCTVFQRNMIVMSADEMGPISIAAYWNGYDWSNVMSHGAYYSYGYSFILYPLFLLFKTPEMFIKSVVVVNSVFSGLMVLFSWLVAKEIKPEAKSSFRVLVAVFCGTFASNVARSSSAWAEVFLALLCWILFYSFVKIYKKGSFAYYLLGAVASVLLYVSHQRMIAVFAVFHVFVLFVSMFDVKKMIKYLITVFMTAGLMVGHAFLKQEIKASVWRNSPSSETNDYGSILIRYFGENYLYPLIAIGAILLFVLLTVVLVALYIKKNKGEESKALRNYRWILVGLFVAVCTAGVFFLNGGQLDLTIYTISAQLLYSGICSLGLAYLGLLFLAYRLYAWIKDGSKLDIESNDLIYAYVFFAFLAIFAFSIINTHYGADPLSAKRSDYMFYGRYFEPMIAPVAFIAAFNLDRVREKKWIYSFLALLMVIFNIPSIIRYNMYFKEIPFLTHNCVACDFFTKDGVVNFVSAAVVMTLFIALFIWINKENVKPYLFIAAIVLSSLMGLTYIEKSVVPADRDKYGIKGIIADKEKLNGSAPLAYIGDEPEFIYNSSFIQYLMPEHKSLVYADTKHIPDYPFYGITDDADFINKAYYNLIEEKNGLYLFTNIDKEPFSHGIPIQIEEFSFVDGVDLNLRDSNGLEGFFMYGPYASLSRGNYEVTFYYSAASKDFDGDKGTFDIAYKFGSIVAGDAEIDDTPYGTCTVPFTLDSDTSQIEFRIYCSDNQDVSIDKVMIKKVIE